MLTEPLEAPDQETIDTWDIREAGVRDGTSPTERFQVTDSGATRTLTCKWQHRRDVAAWLLGRSAIWDDDGTTKLTRLAPQRHPDHDALVATRISSVKGLKFTGSAVPIVGDTYTFNSAQINRFERAVLEVEYEHSSVSYLADDEVAESEVERWLSLDSTEPAAEALQLPGAVMRYLRETGTDAPHNIAIPFNSAVIVPQEIRQVTWFDVPYECYVPNSPLWDRLYYGGSDEGEGGRPYLGSINAVEFLGFPSGTLLLDRVIPKRRRSPLGEWVWDLTFSITFKPSGWNWVYYWDKTATNSGWYFVGPADGEHHYASTVPDGYSLYHARDLHKLFNVSA